MDPHDAYLLSMTAFGFPLRRKYVRHRLRRDPRVLDGYAVYATERGRPVAQVVPLTMPVRLTTGVETVGGLQAVGSLTSVWGQGYARRLIAHAHDLFRDRGLRMTTLLTNRNSRAYGIYRKIGYVDLAPFWRGSRRLRPSREKPRGLHLRVPTSSDLPRMHALYEAKVRGMYGWTERDPRILPMEVAWDRSVLKGFRIATREGRPVGYLRAEPSDGVVAHEAVFPRRRDLRDALRRLEAGQTQEFSAVLCITSDVERAGYRALGYDVYGPMQATAMAMPLTRQRTGDLPSLFGARRGRFTLYETDWF